MCRPFLNRGGINWVGLHSLIHKEIRRFLAVWIQTVIGPVLLAVVLLLIFAVVLGEGRFVVGGVKYREFLAPGLVVMSMVQNAFVNTSSSILIAKQSGTMVDVLMAPLRPIELTLGYVLGGVARGIVVGLLCWAAMLPFVIPGVKSVGLIVWFGMGGLLLFASLGVIGGILAKKMEHIAFMGQVVVTPLTLLSGTFYSIHQLPEAMTEAIRFNPVFHLIDGFRAGFIGSAESNIAVGAAALFAATVVAFCACIRMFSTGYGLKN